MDNFAYNKLGKFTMLSSKGDIFTWYVSFNDLYKMGTYMITPDLLEEIFTYHPPTPEQQVQYQNIRDAAKLFAKVIVDNTPICASQTVAIRKLSELVMDANKAIALRGKF